MFASQDPKPVARLLRVLCLGLSLGYAIFAQPTQAQVDGYGKEIPSAYWLPEMLRKRTQISESSDILATLLRIRDEFAYALSPTQAALLDETLTACSLTPADRALCKVAAAGGILEALAAIFSDEAFNPKVEYFAHVLYQSHEGASSTFAAGNLALLASATLYHFSAQLTDEELKAFKSALACTSVAPAAGVDCAALKVKIIGTRERLRADYRANRAKTKQPPAYLGLYAHDELTLGPVFNPTHFFTAAFDGACLDGPVDYAFPNRNDGYVECMHRSRSAIYAIRSGQLCARSCSSEPESDACLKSCLDFTAKHADGLIGKCMAPTGAGAPAPRPNCLIDLYSGLFTTKPWITAPGVAPDAWQSAWSTPASCAATSTSYINLAQCACTNLYESERLTCKTGCIEHLKSVKSECANWVTLNKTLTGNMHQANDCRESFLGNLSPTCLGQLYGQIQKMPWLNGRILNAESTLCTSEERDYNNLREERAKAVRSFNRKHLASYEKALRIRETKLLSALTKISADSEGLTTLLVELGLRGLQALPSKISCADPRFQAFCPGKRFKQFANRYAKLMGKRTTHMGQLLDIDSTYFTRVSRSYKRTLTKFNRVKSLIRTETERYQIYRACICSALSGEEKVRCLATAGELTTPNVPPAPENPDQFQIINRENCLDFSKVPAVGSILGLAFPMLCKGQLFLP